MGLGLYVEDIGTGGGGFQDFWHLIQGSSSYGYLIQLRDLVDEPLDLPNPGGFPPQGGPPAGGDATTEKHIGEMLVSTIGRVNVGDGPGEYGYVCPTPPKKYIPIYHNLSDIGAVTGGGAAAGSVVG